MTILARRRGAGVLQLPHLSRIGMLRVRSLVQVGKESLLPPQVSDPEKAADNGHDPDDGDADADSCLGSHWESSAPVS